MKNLLSILLLLFVCATASFAQSNEKWDRIAQKAERWADRVSQKAERSAEQFSASVEGWANDLERQFEGLDWDTENWGRRNNSSYNNTCAAYLGIHSDHISRQKAEKLGFKNLHGSYVSNVVKNSAAEKAGLQPFDYIYGVDDQRTSNNQDLTDILADYQPGAEVTLHLVRNGLQKTVNAVLGAYNDYDWQTDRERAFLGIRPASNERSNDLDGVTVEIVRGSSADEMGLKNGDVIQAINGYNVLDWEDVTTAIGTISPGQTTSVTVKREGNNQTLSGVVQSKQEIEDTDESYAGNNDGDWDWDWDWNDDDDDQDDQSTANSAFLGIHLDQISEKKARALGFDNPYGSYVTGVMKNTAAEKAGIMPFDYIFGIDEYRVGDEQRLGGILKKYRAGDEATVHFYRKGKKTSKEVVFRDKAEAKNVSKNKCEDTFLGVVQTDDNGSEPGIVIKPVSGSTAKDIGLAEGDLITHINGYLIYDWSDIGIAVDMLKPGDAIDVDYRRDGAKKTASGKIKSYYETKQCKDCDCGEKNDIVFIAPDIRINMPRRLGSWDEIEEPRPPVSGLNVELENVSSSESKSLTAKGIDMAVTNDLNVNNLTLSPNPNIGMFHLKFNLRTEGETMVKVFNPSGRTIYEYDLGRFSGDFSDYVDISQNGPGTYFLHISQNGKSFVRKVVLKND